MKHKPARALPSEDLQEPKRDWRDVPSLQQVVLDHFGIVLGKKREINNERS